MLKCLNNQIGQNTKRYRLGQYQRSDQKALIYNSELLAYAQVPPTQVANPDNQQQQQILIGQLDNSDAKQEVGKVVSQQIGQIAASTYNQQLTVEPALSDSQQIQNESKKLEEQQTGQLQDLLYDTGQLNDLINDILSSEKQCCVQNLGVFIIQFAMQYNELVIQGVVENGQRRYYKPIAQNAPIFVKLTLEKMNYILNLPADQLDKFLNNQQLWNTVDQFIQSMDQVLTLLENVFNIFIISEWQMNQQTPSIFQLLYNLMAIFVMQVSIQLLMQAKQFTDDIVQQFISPIKIDEQQINKELSFTVGQTGDVSGNYDYSTKKLGFDPKYLIDTYSIQLSTYKRQFDCSGSQQDLTDELIQWLYTFLQDKYVEQIKAAAKQETGQYGDLLNAQQINNSGDQLYQTTNAIVNTSVTLQNYQSVADKLCNDTSFISQLENKINQYKANMGQIDVNVIAQSMLLNSYAGLPGQQMSNQQQQLGSPANVSIRQQFESNMSGFSQVDVIQQNQQLSIQQNRSAISGRYKNLTNEERTQLVNRVYSVYNWLLLKYQAQSGGQQLKNYIEFIVDQLISTDEPSTAECEKCGAMQNMIYKVALNFDLNSMQVKLITNLTQLLFNSLINFQTRQLGQLDSSSFEPPQLINFKQVQSAMKQFVNLFKMEVQKIKQLIRICADDPSKLKSELTNSEIKDEMQKKLGDNEVYKQLLLALIGIMDFSNSIFDKIQGQNNS